MQPFDLLPQFLKKLIQMFLTVILVRSNQQILQLFYFFWG